MTIRRLSAFQDKELAAPQVRQVELHLRECGACRAEWDALRDLEQRLLGLPPAAVDPFFSTRIMAGLRPRPAGKNRLLQAAAFAALFITVFLAGFFLQKSALDRQDAERLPAVTFTSVLLERQDLGLLTVQEDTLRQFTRKRP
jgi:predicted anti-sigma-YlaC factor YlaD